jgi:N-acetylmuramoyl-L-alanine amidase
MCQVNSKVKDAVFKICRLRYSWMIICFIWSFSVAQTAWCTPPLLFDDADAIVALDPGHGGHDRGARGPTGLLEKRVTLELAQKLALRLESRYLVRLTRSDDYNVELHQRTATANHSKADLFISLHTGAGFVHATQGLAVYYYQTGKPGTESVAEGAAVAEPRQWKDLQQRYAAASKALAIHMTHALEAMPQRPSCQVLGAPLAVLQGADMPAILIEVGHITHPATEKLLSQSHGLDALVTAIDQGIERFLAELPSKNK